AGQDRMEGYLEAMDAAGLGRDKKWVKKGGFLRTPARTAAQALFKAEDKPTAIFAASDLMALEVLAVAQAMDIKVPEDCSVIGFDHNLALAGVAGKLATFEQPIADMARVGIESLYQMTLGLAQLPVKILMEAKFVKGKTAGALK
ncbi:MAG: substrate-binding domain-containing protein, partial [Candidatus Omnitrophica bacterium]|nr:substrate-binding domain-containing protein [Candidatus Omnitrophota bacterium]